MFRSNHAPDLAARLAPFIDAGLLLRVPTPWQIVQAEIEMTPYVISSDVTAEEAYLGAPLGHPVVRQPLIFSQIGFDHFGTGSALGARLESLCAHLQLTYHRGMPVFDLQVIQTHPDGLARLRHAMEEALAGTTPLARRRMKIASLILAAPKPYYEKFLGEDGWIARAERFSYATPEDEGSVFPVEFFSLVGLLNYAAQVFPVRRSDVAWYALPHHLLRLAGRRVREGRPILWSIPGRGSVAR